jgi:signal transduction histidine kinase
VLATVAVAQLINLALLALLAPDPPRTVPVGQLAAAIRAQNDGALLMRPVPSPPTPESGSEAAAREIAIALAARLGVPPDHIVIDMAPIQNGKLVQGFARPEGGGPAVAEPALLGHFRVAIRQGDKGWLLVEPRDRGLFDNRERRFLLLFLLSALTMLPVAWIFTKRLSDPFEQFADAAERLGRDPTAAPPAIEGPLELERATAAVRQMQQRLQAYVTDRTQMLGAIAHDLRTPLTRLAFRIDSLEEPQRSAMSADVAEMQAMVTATMGLAKSDSLGSERQRLELGSLVERVADDMALTGRKVSAEAIDLLVIDGDPVALRRLFGNLLDNGEAYGGRAHARVWRDSGFAIVDIDDDGPGVPEAEIEKLFEPFYRVERSRNRETGGIGLGLAVVRSIARAHGGDVTLANRPGGGLRARVSLPLSAGRGRSLRSL